MTGAASEPDRAPLVVVKGDASAEEVAALVSVLQGLAAGPTPDRKRPRPAWAAPHRAVRRQHAAGPGGWRSSTLPR